MRREPRVVRSPGVAMRAGAGRTVAALTLLGAAAIVGPISVDGQTSSSEPVDDAALETYGEADYGWTIRPLDGRETSLESYRGEVLFINLWASWCTPCVRELRSIERLRERIGDADVRFLIVAAEGERPVRRFLRRYHYDLPFYLEISRIPATFALRGLPTSWVVDRDGRIVLLRHGEAVWDTDEVEAFLRRVASAPAR